MVEYFSMATTTEIFPPVDIDELIEPPEEHYIVEASRVECVGRTKKTKDILRNIAFNNCLADIGRINYNRTGRTGVPAPKLCEPFVGNVMVSVPCPKEFYGIDPKDGKRKNLQCSAQNCYIGGHFKGNGLSTVKLDAKRLSSPDAKGTRAQLFKVACADESLEKVLACVEKIFGEDGVNRACSEWPVSFEDIDVTQDFGGSFDKEQVIDYCVGTLGYNMQHGRGPPRSDRPTIVDNDEGVGRNCLSYMDTHDGVKIRGKMYNKFAQMMESYSVSGKIGTHFWNWCKNRGQRLRECIRKCLTYDLGLVRFETTFYGKIPTISQVHAVLERTRRILVPELCYDTPIDAQCREIAAKMRHNLVVYNPKLKSLLIVWWKNGVTGKVTGFVPSAKITTAHTFAWFLGEYSFSGLPTDVIYATWDDKFIRMGVRCFGKILRPDARGRKGVEDDSTRTRIAHDRGIYSALKPEDGRIDPYSCGLDFGDKGALFMPTVKTCAASFVRYSFEERITDVYLHTQSLEAKRKIFVQEVKQEVLAKEQEKKLCERKRVLALRAQEEQRKVYEKGLYERIYAAHPAKFSKVHVGTSFRVDAAGAIAGPYGEYFLLATDKGIFRCDARSKQVIPRLDLAPSKVRGRDIYYRASETPLFTLRIESWRRSTQGNYYAWSSVHLPEDHDGNLPPEDDPKFAGFAAAAVPLLEKRSAIPKRNEKDTPYINKQEVGTRLHIIGYHKAPYRTRECYYLFADDGEVYAGGHFSNAAIEARLQAGNEEQFTLVCLGKKTTPSKGKEMAVQII